MSNGTCEELGAQPENKCRRPLRAMLSVAVLVLGIGGITALAQVPAKAGFQACKGTYALCTFSSCKPIVILGSPLLYSCACEVHRNEWSVGAKSCEPVKDIAEGQFIRSRYHPITTYARCSNNRPWAMCLDSPCIIDKTNPAKAKCTCSAVQGQGDYLVSPGTDQCINGVLSSATVVDLDQITDFLETQPNLLPPDIKVVNVKPK